MQDQGVFGAATPAAKLFAKAPALGTNEIKVIVESLNRPPFMSNLSLVEFDDKAPLEYLELLNRVIGHLDSQHLSVDIQRETQDKTQERICGFLKVLGYPSDFNPSFQRDVELVVAMWEKPHSYAYKAVRSIRMSKHIVHRLPRSGENSMPLALLYHSSGS